MRGEQPVCALHGPEASTELAMLAMLHSPGLRALPLLPALLQPPLTTARDCAVQGTRRNPRMLPCNCRCLVYLTRLCLGVATCPMNRGAATQTVRHAEHLPGVVAAYEVTARQMALVSAPGMLSLAFVGRGGGSGAGAGRPTLLRKRPCCGPSRSGCTCASRDGSGASRARVSRA